MARKASDNRRSNQIVDAAMVRKHFRYDPKSGVLAWRSHPNPRWSRRLRGKSAGSLERQGYIAVSIGNKLYKAHRLIWLYMTGSWPAHEVDHDNRHRADNRWHNLRPANDTQNRVNSKGWAGSGLKGVYRAKSKRNPWYAQIGRRGGPVVYLGVFPTRESAHAAYKAAARRWFGHFAAA